MALKTVWYKIYDFEKHGTTPQHKDNVRSVDIEGKRICLAFDGENYFALDDRCPHAGARFGAGGWCHEGELVCPVHRYRFNLQTGRGTQGDYVNTYPVEKREDGVYVGLEEKKKWWLF
jgi:3-phenylpropionate/trans-cinnamate dioxygenase ferredoxin subunit